MTPTWNERFRAARIASGFSQEKLAKESGVVVRATIAQWESGHTCQPEAVGLLITCRILGVDPYKIMGIK